MRNGLITVASACALIFIQSASVSAKDSVVTPVVETGKSDKLVNAKPPGKCDKVVEFSISDPQAGVYVKHCLDLAAQANMIALRKMYRVRAILWDPDHDILRAFATREDAEVEKGDNQDAELVLESDPDFAALLDQLDRREGNEDFVGFDETSPDRK